MCNVHRAKEIGPKLCRETVLAEVSVVVVHERKVTNPKCCVGYLV